MAKGLEVAITSLHYPGNPGVPTPPAPAVFLTRVPDFQNAQVAIPLCDQRTAQIDVRASDSVMQHIKPYEAMLWVRYRGKLQFWGAITKPDIFANDDPEVVTLPAVDRSLSMQAHYIRRGDGVLWVCPAPDRFGVVGKDKTVPGPSSLPGPDPLTTSGLNTYVDYTNIDSIDERTWGMVPLSETGLRRIMECARLDPTETPGVPDLGIKLGTLATVAGTFYDNTDPGTLGVILNRGDEVWQAFLNLAQAVGTPEFRLTPLDTVMRGNIPPAAGLYYAQLDVAEFIGSEHNGSVIFHHGWGKDNAKIEHTPGGKVVNEAIALSSDNHFRALAFAGESMNEIGLYQEWDQTNIDSAGAAPIDVLDTYAQNIIAAYGRPPDYMAINPKPNSQYKYGDDYTEGTTVHAAYRKPIIGPGGSRIGTLKFAGDARITKVTLAQQSARADDVVEQLEVEPVAVPTGIATTFGDG